MNNKFTLRRVFLNRQGYDKLGRYFGIGAPLYEYSADYRFFDGSLSQVNGSLRAADRDSAKRQIKKSYPRARFHR